MPTNAKGLIERVDSGDQLSSGAHLDDLHVLAVSYWHSTRPSSDKAFTEIVDQIEARATAANFEDWEKAFPGSRGILRAIQESRHDRREGPICR